MRLRAIPTGFWLPASMALVMLTLPLIGMASRVPWGQLGPILSSEASAAALLLSLRTGAISTAACLLVGTPLAFARSLGEFGATITFAGSMQGVTRTLPLEVYLQREQDPDAAEQPTAPVVVTRVSHPPVGFSLRADVPERGVDYELTGRPGETIALIGPNGSGKSTGVRLLAGDITSPQSRVDRPSAVGFLDQSPSLFAHMSVLATSLLGRAVRA